MPPLRVQQENVVPASASLVDKVLLKAVSKEAKNQKVFTLRNIDSGAMNSCDDVRKLIRAQLEADMISHEFDVGLVSGSSVISIRTKADLEDFWSDVRMGKRAMLWCDGLKAAAAATKKNRHKKRIADADLEMSVESGCESDQDDLLFGQTVRKKRKGAAKEEREGRVQQTIKLLKEKHGAAFNPMQIRIWSEMVAGDLHSNLDNPPTTSMFTRAGDGGRDSSKKIKSDSNSLTEAFTQAAAVLSSALSPSPRPRSNSPACSPVKQIEARSKCYKQLGELNNLRQAGVLTEEEYTTEKHAVLQVLKSM